MSIIHDVFISYCRNDATLMKSIQDCLKKQELNVWVDENIEQGSPSWRADISVAIKGAGCLIVILTPSVPESRWVIEELAYAEEHEKSVYPILALGEPKDSVPFGYMSSNWIDVRNEDTCGTNIQQLVDTIKKKYKFETDKTEYFQSLVKMTGKWRLDYSGLGFVGTGVYHFDEDNNFEATVFNPIFSANEEQKGTWKIENNVLIVQGFTTLHGQSMPFRGIVKILRADIEGGIIEASVTRSGSELLGKLTRIK